MSVGPEEQAREGIARVCRYYLGPPVSREDARLVFICPSCEGASFAANLVTRKAGCWTGRCPPGRYADALELVSHFEGAASPPEVMKRAGEILALLPDESSRPEEATTERARIESRRREDGRSEHGVQRTLGQSYGQGPVIGNGASADVRVAATAATGRLARTRVGDGGNESGVTEEGWYAVLAAPEGPLTGPKVYWPGGVMRPLPSSAATGAELLAALVVFLVVAACAWMLVGHAGPPLSAAGLSEVTNILVRNKAACALSIGALASLATWALLSGRRHAERQHLGDDRRHASAKTTTSAGPLPARKAARGSQLNKGGERG